LHLQQNNIEDVAQIIEARAMALLSFKLFTSEAENKYWKPGAIDTTLTLTRVCADCREVWLPFAAAPEASNNQLDS
jgi:hypothetical protein